VINPCLLMRHICSGTPDVTPPSSQQIAWSFTSPWQMHYFSLMCCSDLANLMCSVGVQACFGFYYHKETNKTEPTEHIPPCQLLWGNKGVIAYASPHKKVEFQPKSIPHCKDPNCKQLYQEQRGRFPPGTIPSALAFPSGVCSGAETQTQTPCSSSTR